MKVRIALFGAFRKYSSDARIELDLPSGVTIERIKQELNLFFKIHSSTFNDASLLNSSAIANEESILNDSTVIHSDSNLAILPPVCGG